MSTPPTITLSVLLAPDAPVAVVLRRGPSRCVQVIRWDTSNDTFEDGQWFDGRIYLDRCALSPDGTLMLYVAMAAHWRRDADWSRGATTGHWGWTAISRVPWLTALVFTPDGPGPSGGGGRFITDELATVGRLGHVWLPARPRVVNAQWEAARQRCQRDDNRSLHPTLEGYVIRLHDKGIDLPLPGVSWAGWDQMSRLIYVRRAALYAATLDGDAVAEVELADFDDGRQPSWGPSPEWARRWD